MSRRFWFSGDWSAFFGYLMQSLSSFVGIAALLSMVVGLPDNLVYTRIVPGMGLAFFLHSVLHTGIALYRKSTWSNTSVCALPVEMNMSQAIFVIFAVVAPVFTQKQDAQLAWSIGLLWTGIAVLTQMLTAAFAKPLLRILPNAAILGTLAGSAIIFSVVGPAIQMWETPLLAILGFTLVLATWMGKRTSKYSPLIGTSFLLIGAIVMVTLGAQDSQAVQATLEKARYLPPLLSWSYLKGVWSYAPEYLLTAVPFAVYNMIHILANLKSAEEAGDVFPTQAVFGASILSSIVGVLFGSCFFSTVRTGHPAWKQLEAQQWYVLAVGICILILSQTGLTPLIIQTLPMAFILPVLLYVGMVVAAQAFSASPRRHTPAVIVAIFPWITMQSEQAVRHTLSLFHITPHQMLDGLNQVGLHYQGLFALSHGTILTGLLLGSITAMALDKRWQMASGFALFGSVSAYFGLIHADRLGITTYSVQVALAYLSMAGVLFVYSFWDTEAREREKTPSVSLQIPPLDRNPRSE